MRAALYLRISADRTGEELGVSRQKEDCLALARLRGWDVVAEYAENDTSASGSVKRPKFAQMLCDLEDGNFDVVIAWSLDRLTRNRHDTVRLIELGQKRQATIALARGSDLDMSTPMGRMMADQLAGWARFEIEQKSDRQKRANQQRAMNGQPHRGWRAFGYDQDGVTIYEPEAAVLREMARRVIAGHGYKDVARWANSNGYTTSRGNPWYPKTVRQILMFKRYAGIREYEGVEYAAVWQPIFDQPTWERLQLAIRLKTATYKGTVPIARKYLLTGLVYCGACGQPLNGSTKRDRAHRPLRRTYYCRSAGDQQQGSCGKVQRGAPALEHFVTECVLTRLDSPQLGDLLKQSHDDGQLRTLLELRSAAQERLNAVLDDYATGVLTRAEMIRVKATASAEVERLTRELGKATGERQRVGLPVGETLREAWRNAGSDTWRRSLMELVIKRVVVNPTKDKPWYMADGKAYRFSPYAVDIDWQA